MKCLFIIILIATFISCNQDQSEKHQTNSISTSINKNSDDTIYKDNRKLIIKTKNSVDTLLKFKSHIRDTSYSVAPQDIKLTKELDFSNYEYKKMYITKIKEGIAEQGVNFAGHFCLVYWGCGSPCKLSAVIDLKTGKVYNGLPSEIGYEFRKDSRLLIINPPDSTGWYNKNIPWQPPSEYIWTDKEFMRLISSS